MKTFFQVFCLVLICSVPVTGNGAESYRAHFEEKKHDLDTPLLTQSTHGSSPLLLKQTFHSKLVGGQNGPLEFEVAQNGCKVSGIIALSLIR